MKQAIKNIILFVCLVSAANCQAILRVVTTTEDLAAIARAIGGSFVDVVSLTRGTRDPHFAEAKPSMISKVYLADLLILVGADMEVGWLPRLLQSARNTKVQQEGKGYLDISLAVPLLGQVSSPVSRAMGDVHAKGNPHYWLNPHNGVLMARAIADKLSELDPNQRDDYQARLAVFTETLKKKIEQWKTTLAPLRNQAVIAYHTSFIYLADAFGFTIADEVEPKPGIAPSAAHLIQLVKRIKTEQIGLLVIETYYEKRSALSLKDQTGIHIAVLPHSVGALPQIKTYFDLFDRIVIVLSQTEEA